MKTFLLWLFGQISYFVETSLSWKIYGNFSLTHFLLASLFLIALFKLFGFSFGFGGDAVETIALSYKNAENKKDKENYYHVTRQARSQFKKDGVRYTATETRRYKVNRKTGEAREI